MANGGAGQTPYGARRTPYGARRLPANFGDAMLVLGRRLCLAYVIYEYVGWFTLTMGPSMEPSLLSGDVLLGDQFTARFFPEKLRRGDLVNLYKPGSEPPFMVCKRIKGLPGDVVISRPSFGGPFGVQLSSRVAVPPGHVWVEGDNPPKSTDSRVFGPVPMALVTTRQLAIVWPPSRMRLV